MSVQKTTTLGASVAGTRTNTLLASAFSVVFGLVIVGFVGFSPMETLHNAAHDTRHANAFPCH
jgi:cobalt transporter subunit CbtB